MPKRDWCFRATSLMRKAELWEREIDNAAAELKSDPAAGLPFHMDEHYLFGPARHHIANLREKALRITINEGE